MQRRRLCFARWPANEKAVKVNLHGGLRCGELKRSLAWRAAQSRLTIHITRVRVASHVVVRIALFVAFVFLLVMATRIHIVAAAHVAAVAHIVVVLGEGEAAKAKNKNKSQNQTQVLFHVCVP